MWQLMKNILFMYNTIYKKVQQNKSQMVTTYTWLSQNFPDDTFFEISYEVIFASYIFLDNDGHPYIHNAYDVVGAKQEKPLRPIENF